MCHFNNANVFDSHNLITVSFGLTSVDSGEGQRGQTLALHLLLLLKSPLGLQDWILKLGPPIYVAGTEGKKIQRARAEL